MPSLLDMMTTYPDMSMFDIPRVYDFYKEAEAQRGVPSPMHPEGPQRYVPPPSRQVSGPGMYEPPPPDRKEAGLLDFAAEHIDKGMGAYDQAPPVSMQGLMSMMNGIPKSEPTGPGSFYSNPYLSKLGGF